MEELYQVEFLSLGTFNTIQVYGKNAKDVLLLAKKRVEEIDDEMSIFKDTSEISLINKEAGNKPVSLTNDLLSLLHLAIEVNTASNGAFNILIKPLSSLWHFSHGESSIPRQDDINKAKNLIDPKAFLLNNDQAFLLKKGMGIDLGGIAKGYAADEVKRILKENGLKDALINLGGNILAMGSFESNKPWKIGIRNPFSLNNDYFTIISTHEEAIVTSGVDEQFFIKDGIKYHHIIDPRSGYPAQSNLASVTIIGANAALADALATASFIMGIEESKPLILKNNMKAIFVKANGDVYSTFPLEKLK